MLWKPSDKAAGIRILTEMTSQLTPEEVFQCVLIVQDMLGERLDWGELETQLELAQNVIE